MQHSFRVESATHPFGERRPRLPAARGHERDADSGPREQAVLPGERLERGGLELPRGALLPHLRLGGVAGAALDLSGDARLAALEQQREPAGRKQVDRARA